MKLSERHRCSHGCWGRVLTSNEALAIRRCQLVEGPSSRAPGSRDARPAVAPIKRCDRRATWPCRYSTAQLSFAEVPMLLLPSNVAGLPAKVIWLPLGTHSIRWVTSNWRPSGNRQACVPATG